MRCVAMMVIMLTGAPALAQHAGHAGHGPYAGLETRAIKALSPEDVDGLKAGRGMGLALAAELNGYPGPMHVLELADVLKLTPDQRPLIEASMAKMRTSAQALGEQIIEAERHLDMRFQHRHIDPASLSDLTARIGRLQGELRAVHLAAHLDMAAVLTADQINAYTNARGYAGKAPKH